MDIGASRTEVDPGETGAKAFYKLLNSVVVPRPIAWVSSVSADGVVNLAPHSFFTVSCVDPPMVQFTSVGVKDSLRNVRATGEFVVNLTPEHLFEQVNATGTNFPPDVDEFAAVGLPPEASTAVAPPRVAGSPVALECRLEQAITLGDSTIVIGRVLLAALDPAVLDERGRPLIDRLRPLARLGGIQWSTIGEIKETTRIPHEEWPGHYRKDD